MENKIIFKLKNYQRIVRNKKQNLTIIFWFQIQKFSISSISIILNIKKKKKKK